MIEAELHDGTILEFPDDTPDDVVNRTVKNYLGQSATAPEAPSPTAETTPELPKLPGSGLMQPDIQPEVQDIINPQPSRKIEPPAELRPAISPLEEEEPDKRASLERMLKDPLKQPIKRKPTGEAQGSIIPRLTTQEYKAGREAIKDIQTTGRIINQEMGPTTEKPFTSILDYVTPDDDATRDKDPITHLAAVRLRTQELLPQVRAKLQEKGYTGPDLDTRAWDIAHKQALNISPERYMRERMGNVGMMERYAMDVGSGAIGTAESGLQFFRQQMKNSAPSDPHAKEAYYRTMDNIFARMAGPMQDQMKYWSPSDPNFIDQVFQGIGSSATFWIPGIGAAKGVAAAKYLSVAGSRWLGAGASGFMEAVFEAGGVYDQAIAEGMSHEEANRRANATLAANTVFITLMDRVGIFGEYESFVPRMLGVGVTEGLQESGQQVISNVATDHPIMEGVGEAGAVGGIAGMVGGGALNSLMPTTEDQINQAIKDYAENIEDVDLTDLARRQATELLNPARAQKQLVKDVVNEKQTMTPEEAQVIVDMADQADDLKPPAQDQQFETDSHQDLRDVLGDDRDADQIFEGRAENLAEKDRATEAALAEKTRQTEAESVLTARQEQIRTATDYIIENGKPAMRAFAAAMNLPPAEARGLLNEMKQDGTLDQAMEARKIKLNRDKAERMQQRANVNETEDDLLAAIAKLGGISREEAEAQGIDPAAFGSRGHGIRRVFTKNGLSFDAMAETLMQYGYPVADEQGNYNPNTLLEKLSGSLAGSPVYTAIGTELQAEQAYRDEMIAQEEEALAPVFDTAADLVDEGTKHEQTPDLVDIQTRAMGILGEGAYEDIMEATAVRGQDLSDEEYEALVQATLQEAIYNAHQTATEEAVQDDAGHEGSRPVDQTRLQEGQQEQPAEAVTTDLAGAVDNTAQAIHDQQEERSRKEREAPAMAEGPGDLFTGASKQTDIADVAVQEPNGDQTGTEQSRDRRQDLVTRKKVADMSPEEMQEALLVDHLTGLGNRRAYDESEKLPVQVSIDVDALKWVNDNMGHESGDKLLQLMGRAIQEYTDDGYHISGDEFVIQSKVRYSAESALEQVTELLGKSVITVELPDGGTLTKTGVEFSYGIGDTLNEAETELRKNKEQREAEGKRAVRGAEPAGVSRTAAEGQQDQEREPADEVTPTVDKAAHEAATSPKNDLPEPTEAQKETGNYKKGRLTSEQVPWLSGLEIMIENPAGSKRNPAWPALKHHYGYFRRSDGYDGDEVDVFLGPNMEEAPSQVFVIDQVDPKTGQPDEHKVVLGVKTKAQAKRVYLANYEKGWNGFGGITAYPLDEFKQKLKAGFFKNSTPARNAPAKKAAPSEKIDDLGEKIGGARKDTATSIGKRRSSKKKKVTGWRTRYAAVQNVGSVDQEWTLVDKRTGRAIRQPGEYKAMRFSTQEEAEKVLPLVAVAQKHSVYRDRDKKFTIWRRISDRKRVRVVADAFDTRDEAMKYMADHAEEIMDTKLSFGEEILPTPEKVYRTGKKRRQGDVAGDDFMTTFGFRAVEFGNWNNQAERQEVMNHAYDAMLDLADILNVDPLAMSLGSDLALAFGARGQGLTGAKAHYETGYAVINLTKMKGAGSLAHEWFHALDHYFARLDGKVSGEKVKNASGDLVYKQGKSGAPFASHGFLYNSKAREELRGAYTALIKTMFKKAETYVEDTQKVEKFVGKARDELRNRLNNIREGLAQQLDPKYWKRNNKPATPEQLARFDALADMLINGEGLEMESRENKGSRAMFSYRTSNDILDEMADIYKKVRGRSGFLASREGTFDKLRPYISIYRQRIEAVKDAQSGAEKVKQVPTSFYMQAKAADQARSGDYWSSEHEMAARAFAAYVEDRLAEKEAGNDFLAYHAHGAVIVPIYPEGFFRPYPEGEERAAVNKAFDRLFKTIKTRTDNGRVVMYSKGKLTFDDAVDAATQGKRELRHGMIAGKTPPILQRLGLSDENLITTGKVVDKAHFDHGLTLRDLKNIDQLIADPVMVFESDTVPGAYTVVLDLFVSGHPIYVAIHPNVNMDPFSGHKIATISERKNHEDIRRWIQRGRLRYVNKDKSLEWSKTARLQLPAAELKRGSGKIVLTEQDIVKGVKYSALAGQPLFSSNGAYSDVYLGRRNDIGKQVKTILRQIAPGANLKLVDRLIAEGPGAYMSGTEPGQPAAGASMENIIWVAMNYHDPAQTAWHEAVHFLRRAGLFSKAEWAALERKAKQTWLQEYDVPDTEEAIAYAMGDIRGGQQKAGGLMLRAYNKVRRFFQRLANWLRSNGFRNWEDVFQSVATGEIGGRQLGGQRSGIRYAIPKQNELFEGFDVPSETAKELLFRKIQDRMRRLRTIQKSIQADAGRQIPEYADAYLHEELFYGKTEADLLKFEDDYVEPLVQALSRSDVSVDDLDLFLYAKHAPERNAHIQEINQEFRENDIPGSGMSDQEAADILRDFDERGMTAELDNLARQVYAVNSARLDLIEAAGLESKERVEGWRQQYDHYVPLKGQKEEPGRMRTGRGYDIRGRESKKALGRVSRAESPMTHAIAQMEETIIRSRKNDVGVAFLRLVLENPNPGLWEATQAKSKPKPWYNPQTREVETIRDKTFKLADNVMSVKVNGKEFYITMHDEALATAMKNLGSDTNNAIIRSLAAFNRYLALVNTALSPEFVASNFVRDLQTAMINLVGEQDAKGSLKEPKKMGRKVVKDLPMALKGALNVLRDSHAQGKWEDWFREYRDSGGKIGFFGLEDITTKRKRLQRIINEAEGGGLAKSRKMFREIGDLIMDVNGAVENGVRLATYANARQSGLSEAKAASLARNLTVNFNRKGQLGSAANALYLFFNAGLQGSARLLYAARSRRVQKILIGIAVFSFILTELNRMIAGDDDDGENYYDKLPDWEKERNIIIMMPDGHYFKFPLPYGYNVPFVFGETANGVIHGRDKTNAAVHMVNTIMGSFNPLGSVSSDSAINSLLKQVSPTITDPILEIGLNENFAGYQIKPENFPFGPEKPQSQLYWNSVNPYAKSITDTLNELTGGNPAKSGMIDVSPEHIEYLTAFFTGSAGRFVVNTLSAPAFLLSDEDIPTYKIPFVRRLYGKMDDRTTTQRYYDHSHEVEQLVYEYEWLKGNKPEEVHSFKSEYGHLLRLQTARRTTTGKLRRANKMIRRAETLPDLSDAERRAKIKEAREKKQVIMKRFNKKYNDAVKAATDRTAEKKVESVRQ